MNKVIKEFIIFRRPSCCVRDFLAQDCNGNYHKLQEINPKDIFQAQNQDLLEKIDESLEGIQNMDRKMLSIKEVREIIKKLIK